VCPISRSATWNVCSVFNKEIAARLGIAQRTVETHRANVMKKMGVATLSELVRLVISARGADSPSESASDSTVS